MNILMLTDKEFEDLNTLLEYLLENEKTHYEESDGYDHIYLCALRVQDAINKSKGTAPCII